MKDLKSLFNAAKQGVGRDREKALIAFNEAVDAMTNDPAAYLTNLEYIIRTSHGLESFKTFQETYAIPISGYLVLENAVIDTIEACSRRGLPQLDVYIEMAKEVSNYLDTHQHAVAMFEEFKDKLPGSYIEAYYATEGFKDPGFVNKYGVGVIPDAILSMSASDVPAYLEAVSNNMILNSPEKQQWLMEASKHLENDTAVKSVREKISEKSLSGLVKSKRLRDQILYRESVIMNKEDASAVYTEVDIQHLMDLASFNESLATSLRTEASIGEAMQEAYAAHEDLDGLVTESGDMVEEACADVAGMLPGTGNQLVTEEAISHKKHGRVPTYLGKHHDLDWEEEGDDKQKSSEQNNTDDYSRPEHTSEPESTSTDTYDTDEGTDDNDGNKDKDNVPRKDAAANIYYYNYYNSFNKHQSSKDDHSTKNVGTDNSSHVTNDHSSNVSSKNKDTSIAAKESGNPWDMNIFDEEVFCEAANPEVKRVLSNLKELRKVVQKVAQTGMKKQIKEYNKDQSFLNKMELPTIKFYFVDYDKHKSFNIINSLDRYVADNIDGMKKDASTDRKDAMSQYLVLAFDITKHESTNERDAKAFNTYLTFLTNSLKGLYDKGIISIKESGKNYVESYVYVSYVVFINAKYIIEGDSLDSFLESASGDTVDPKLLLATNNLITEFGAAGNVITQSMSNRYNNVNAAVYTTLEFYKDAMKDIYETARKKMRFNPFFNGMRIKDPTSSDYEHQPGHGHSFMYLEAKDDKLILNYDVVYFGYAQDFVHQLKKAGKNDAQIVEYTAIFESEWTDNFAGVLAYLGDIESQLKDKHGNKVKFEIKSDTIRHEGAFAELTVQLALMEGDMTPYVEAYATQLTQSGCIVRDGNGNRIGEFPTESEADEWIGDQENPDSYVKESGFTDAIKSGFKKIKSKVNMLVKKTLPNLQSMDNPKQFQQPTKLPIIGTNIPLDVNKSQTGAVKESISMHDIIYEDGAFYYENGNVFMSKNDIKNIAKKLRDKFNAEILFINPDSPIAPVVGMAAVIQTDRDHINKIMNGTTFDVSTMPSTLQNPDGLKLDKVIAINTRVIRDFNLTSPKSVELLISHEYGHVKTFDEVTNNDWVEYTIKKNVMTALMQLAYGDAFGITDKTALANLNKAYYQLKPEAVANKAVGINPDDLCEALFGARPDNSCKKIDLDYIVSVKVPQQIIDMNIRQSTEKNDVLAALDFSKKVYAACVKDAALLYRLNDSLAMQEKYFAENLSADDLMGATLFTEDADDAASEDDDPEKPKSDHPVKDTLQDIDRKLTKSGAEAKRKVNDAINVTKAAAKPFKRTAGWINNLIARFKDADETKIKEQMADPRSRSAVYKGIKAALAAGAFYKAGLLTNPLFLFLAVTRKISKKKNMTRIRNEMTGEIQTEIDVLTEKIKDADYAGNRAAKYKMMRLKNELQKKLIRVAGDKATAKVL